MININNLKGSIVAIITPFDEEGNIDFKAMETLLDFQLNNGTKAIVVCGTTGETPTLTTDEYREVIAFSVEKINSRIPVIAGVGTNNTQSTIENCRVARAAGVDGLLISTPYYNKPTQSGLYSHFAQVASNTDLPIILYNVPGRTSVNMTPLTTLRLANDFENIVGIKEASGDINQIMEILSNRPAGFRIYSGDDNLALIVSMLGGDGCISVVANQIPSEFSEMLDLCFSGNIEEAKEIHFRHLNLMNLNFIESNPAPVKYVLNKMGLIKNKLRLPLVPVNDESAQKLDQELENIFILTA